MHLWIYYLCMYVCIYVCSMVSWLACWTTKSRGEGCKSLSGQKFVFRFHLHPPYSQLTLPCRWEDWMVRDRTGDLGKKMKSLRPVREKREDLLWVCMHPEFISTVTC